MAMDFVAGCVGGIAGLFVGHPFDTAKVHLQTNPKYKGTFQCMAQIVKTEQFRGLYKGLSSPIAGVGLVNAVVFGVYGNVQRFSEQPDSLSSHFYAGSVAGLIQSLVCAPMELTKTHCQLQSETHPLYKGPMDCARKIWHREGLRGLFRGLSITAARDVPGFSSYFVTYEYLMRQTAEPNALFSLVAGGFAGMASWVVCYPMDIIKTSIQVDGMAGNRKYRNSWDCMRQNYASNGYRFFLRGLSSSLWRAYPMNAACFFVVSIILRMSTSNKAAAQTPEPMAIVGAGGAPLCHIQQTESRDDDLKQKRWFMAKALKHLGAFNEAVCHTEADELAKEFFPEHKSSFYLQESNASFIDSSIREVRHTTIDVQQQIAC